MGAAADPGRSCPRPQRPRTGGQRSSWACRASTDRTAWRSAAPGAPSAFTPLAESGAGAACGRSHRRPTPARRRGPFAACRAYRPASRGGGQPRHRGPDLVETWNGQRGRSRRRRAPAGRQEALEAVDFRRATTCTAVGNWFYLVTYRNIFGGESTYPVNQTLVELWNGTTWSIVPSAEAAAPWVSSFLYGVSCRPHRGCVAVGDRRRQLHAGLALRLRDARRALERTGVVDRAQPRRAARDGPATARWRRCRARRSPSASPSASPATVATARPPPWSRRGTARVGPSRRVRTWGPTTTAWPGCRAWPRRLAWPSGRPRTTPRFPDVSTVVEAWNGSTWSVGPSPNATFPDNVLDGVSCRYAHCVAVGSDQQTNMPLDLEDTLALHR